VPYPGTFIEADLLITGPDQNNNVHFTVPIFNRGNDLDTVSGIIAIVEPSDNVFDSIATSSRSFKAQEQGKIVGSWAGVHGSYRARATISFDSGSLVVGNVFSVGTAVLEITDIRAGLFTLGEIARFDVTIESRWNDVVGATATMTVVDGDQEIRQYVSPSFGVPVNDEAVIPLFWETAGIEEGSYELRVSLEYEGKITESSYPLHVNKNSIVIGDVTRAEFDINLIPYAVGIVLMLVVIAGYLYWRRKKELYF